MAEDFDVEAMLEAPYQKNVSCEFTNQVIMFKLSPSGLYQLMRLFCCEKKQLLHMSVCIFFHIDTHTRAVVRAFVFVCKSSGAHTRRNLYMYIHTYVH